MTTQIDFYVLQNQNATALFPFCCRLCAKAYAKRQALQIHCANDDDAKSLDTMLWTYDERQFIPHRLAQDIDIQEAPIVIGTPWQCPAPEPERIVLINLNHEIPKDPLQWSRIIEVVPAEDTWRSVAREKYINYREAGCALQHHAIA